VHFADRPALAVGELRDRDQTNLIGDEALRPDFDLMRSAPFRLQFQIVLVILIAKKASAGDGFPVEWCGGLNQVQRLEPIAASTQTSWFASVGQQLRMPRNPVAPRHQ
jgi:hypothetical protein